MDILQAKDSDTREAVKRMALKVQIFVQVKVLEKIARKVKIRLRVSSCLRSQLYLLPDSIAVLLFMQTEITFLNKRFLRL